MDSRSNGTGSPLQVGVTLSTGIILAQLECERETPPPSLKLWWSVRFPPTSLIKAGLNGGENALAEHFQYRE